MKELIKDLNVNVSSLVRSGVILLLGVPVVMAFGNSLNTSADASRLANLPDLRDLEIESVQGKAAPACIKYLVSKDESKLEREAQNELDDIFGGEVNHGEVCKWVFS